MFRHYQSKNGYSPCLKIYVITTKPTIQNNTSQYLYFIQNIITQIIPEHSNFTPMMAESNHCNNISLQSNELQHKVSRACLDPNLLIFSQNKAKRHEKTQPAPGGVEEKKKLVCTCPLTNPYPGLLLFQLQLSTHKLYLFQIPPPCLTLSTRGLGADDRTKLFNLFKSQIFIAIFKFSMKNALK